MTHSTFRYNTSLSLLVGLLAACSGAGGAHLDTGDAEAAAGATSAADSETAPSGSRHRGTAASAGSTDPSEGEPKPDSAGGASNDEPSAHTGDAKGAVGGEGGVSDAQGASSGDTRAAGTDSKAMTPQDWMSAIAGLDQKPLNEIYLPGTHDSGTYGLISAYNRPVDDVFAPDDLENAVIRLGQFVGVSDLWSKAQDKSISEQLNDGIRVIDLRPCVEKNGTLRVCHALYAAKMSEILDAVAAFSAQHPKEFLLLDLATFSGMTTGDHQRLITAIKDKLGDRLLSYADHEVSPTTTLGSVWKTGKSIAVIYEHAQRDAAFMPGASLTISWSGEVWKRDATHTRLQDAAPTKPGQTFFWFSAQATPNSELIEYSLDPLGNYPKSLEALAAATNPVALGWVQSDWASKPLNIMAVDFYEHSCVVQLAQSLNGGKPSFDGCSIGRDTDWGKWALAPYGRGAGVPMVCAPGEERVAALCYDRCKSGYSSDVLFPYLCQQGCPSGYSDLGLTCTRGSKIISSNTSSCPFLDACGVVTGCSKCPDGYHNDGCTCRIDISTVTKARYDRGVGRPLDACPAGTEQSGLLCYPTCRSGFHGEGPLCVPN